MNKGNVVSFAFTFCVLMLSGGAIQAQETLTLGVVPQQSAKVLAQKWTPLTRYLAQTTGIKVKFITARDIPTFEARLAEKVYDLAYMNPYHFVHFNQLTGYQALAKQKGKRIQGIFVVRKGSNVTQLADLHGTSLAFPAPAAFAASILPRGTLKEQGIKFTPRYVASHDSVYLNVVKGHFPAGGGVLRTFQLAPEVIRQELQVLYTTRAFTPHALAAAPHLKPETAGKLLAALFGLETLEAGKTILRNLNMQGFESASNSDWDDVRALDLSELVGSELVDSE